MQHDPEIQVLCTYRINVILDVTQGSSLCFGVVVVDVMDNLLRAIVSGNCQLAKTRHQDDGKGCTKTGTSCASTSRGRMVITTTRPTDLCLSSTRCTYV